ncbi:hypothetical protein Glove_21g328 [Diversispora epigaea]|uniref:Uncharacterized protein n=1 Tax=Diversispora epigaea TaxID=1348612 RepID=A0A397JRJ9_9GLOM|nr:hypothetical protein Glove_21g328 [Diversispora epigaea]
MIPNIFAFSPVNLDLKNFNATLLERFINYPSSPSPATIIKNDKTILRLIGELQVQGRTFRTLSKVSATKCKGLTQLTNEIITTFSSSPSSSYTSLKEILKEFDLIRKGYYDISQNLNRISQDFQIHKSTLEKELYILNQEVGNLSNSARKQKFNTIKKGLMVGLGIGSLSNATLYIISPSLDGGLTLFATIITGGIMGWYCGKKMNERLKCEIKIKSNEIRNLKNNTNYIDLVVNDINKFDESIIKNSKTFWTKQVDLANLSLELINNKNSDIKRTAENNYKLTVESLLVSWNQAKSTISNYQNSVNSILCD